MTSILSRTSLSFAAAGVVLTVAACGNAQQAEEPGTNVASITESDDEKAFFAQLLTTPYSGNAITDEDPVDFAIAFADLPDGVSLQTGNVSVIAESGATRVEDFAIVYDLEGSPVGLEADEVLFYGFDPNAIADRIRGSNLEASVNVADRIELRGVKSVGMEAVSKLMMDQYVGAIDEFTSLDGEVITELNAVDVFNYNFEMNTLLIDGFDLHPFVYTKFEEENADPDIVIEGDEFAEPQAGNDTNERQGFQMVGAFMRAFSLDAVVYDDLSFTYAMRDNNVEINMGVTIGLTGVRDYDRGDMAYSGSWDTLIDGEFPIPDPDGDGTTMKAVPMTGGVTTSTVSGFKMAKAFEAMANWEMPDTTVTDVFDLGRWEMQDYTLDIAEKSLFNADEIVIESDFHWLLPTTISLSLSNTGYNIGNLFEVMTQEMGEELEPGLSAEDLRKGLEIVEQYGFDCLCGDFSLNLNWDEDTGAISYREKGRFAEAFKGSTSADIGFSTPARMAGLFDLDDPEAEFETAFKEDFEFRGFETVLTDTGGLSNIFEMLHAIGQAFPDQEGMAMLTYNDAAQLRMFSINMVNSMRPFARQEFPGVDPYMDAVAAFLEEGGTLTLSANPPTPITVALIESLEESGIEPGPDEMVEIVGLTVTHTK